MPDFSIAPDGSHLLRHGTPFVLVAESFNVNTGLGSRFGTELLKAGFKGRYNNIGTHKEGCGGLWQQMGYQGLDPAGIARAITALAS